MSNQWRRISIRRKHFFFSFQPQSSSGEFPDRSRYFNFSRDSDGLKRFISTRTATGGGIENCLLLGTHYREEPFFPYPQL